MDISVFPPQALPASLTAHMAEFSLARCCYSIERWREGTGRVVVWRSYGVRGSYTLECTAAGADTGARRVRGFGDEKKLCLKKKNLVRKFLMIKICIYTKNV